MMRFFLSSCYQWCDGYINCKNKADEGESQKTKEKCRMNLVNNVITYSVIAGVILILCICSCCYICYVMYPAAFKCDCRSRSSRSSPRNSSDIARNCCFNARRRTTRSASVEVNATEAPSANGGAGETSDSNVDDLPPSYETVMKNSSYNVSDPATPSATNG